MSVVRAKDRDSILIGLSIAHGALLALGAPFALVGVLFWWNANTVAHNFIHVPFFRTSAANRVFSCYLTGILGVSQSGYRARHLRHHGLGSGAASSGLHRVEIVLALGVWAGLALLAPRFFWTSWVPGIVLGAALCGLHSRLEHTRGTRDHHGRLYNWLLFNDGYHVAHHEEPARHWTSLPEAASGGLASHWPPILRWLEIFDLVSLERLVLKLPRLQRFMLRTHQKALESFRTRLEGVRTVTVVGGGMFPRTAILLRQLLPNARIVIMDASAESLELARPYLPGDVATIEARFDPGHPWSFGPRPDLVVIPLSLVGDRERIYRDPPARRVLVHDWIWSRPEGRTVSWLLAKKLVLSERGA